MTRQEMREFAAGQVEWYEDQNRWIMGQIEWINNQLKRTRKEDKAQKEFAQTHDSGKYAYLYEGNYKGKETRKLVNERRRYQRELKKNAANIEYYKNEVKKYTETEAEAETIEETAEEAKEVVTMKKYFKVTFEYAEGIYCTNLAHAETAEDVEREYSEYAWKSIKEAQPWDVEEAKMKGMPIIEVEAAPAEDPEAVTLAPAEMACVWDENGDIITPDTDTEEEEEEQNMKPEYKHIYVEEARRQLEARKDRSAWDRAVTEDAIDLLDTVNDRCEQVTRQFAETEEGGAAHVRDLFVSRVSLMNVMKNGADSWHDYSWGGCGLIYDGDIAEHYCTPSELIKTRHGERRPNSREEWLDVQARALRQAAGRAADALIAASLKTYTVKGV